MHIDEDRTRMIFKSQKDDKVFYSIGLSRKDKDGNYINGYMNCSFPKDTEIENKTKIKIVDGWIDFYIKDKITYPYLFINKYEIINDENDIPQNVKSDYEDNGIEIKDSDLPF